MRCSNAAISRVKYAVFPLWHVDTRPTKHESDTNLDFAVKADPNMTRTPLILAMLALLAACGDGQPLFDDAEADAEDTATDGIPFEEVAVEDVDDPDDVLNAGTVAPPLLGTLTQRGDIVRVEAPDGNGGGFTSLFSYSSDGDVFLIDGLAFDGLNEYERFASLPQLGTVAVYQGDATVADFLTGTPVSQIVPYFALYDVSDVIIDEGEDDQSFRTSFAVVRTGGYDDYGFGTFAYERAGGFVIPTEGQATFSGTYAGLRISETFSTDDLAVEDILTSADINIDIDFDDFNGTPGIKGVLSNRQAYDQYGSAIETNRSITTTDGSANAIQLPNLPFIIRGDGTTISADGEIGGNLANTIIDRSGAIREYETGTYAGIIAGDLTDENDGGEIVGVIVIESEDSRFDGIVFQETGGFIATR
jgi:hypothetical protein